MPSRSTEARARSKSSIPCLSLLDGRSRPCTRRASAWTADSVSRTRMMSALRRLLGLTVARRLSLSETQSDSTRRFSSGCIRVRSVVSCAGERWGRAFLVVAPGRRCSVEGPLWHNVEDRISSSGENGRVVRDRLIGDPQRVMWEQAHRPEFAGRESGGPRWPRRVRQTAPPLDGGGMHR